MNVATIAVVSLVAAVAAAGLFFIRLGCRLSAGFWPSWSTAAKAMGLCFLASLPFTMLMPAMAHSIGAVFVFSALLLLVGAWLLGVMLKHPETGPIGIKKGGVASLVWGVGGFAVVGIAGVVMAILIPRAGQDGGASTSSQPLPVDPAAAVPAVPQPSLASANPFTDPNYGLPSQPNKFSFEEAKGEPAPQAPAPPAPQPAAPPSDNQLTQAAINETLTRFPYLDGPGSEKWVDAAVAWRDAYQKQGEPNHLAIKHGAEMVDRYRTAGHGACSPVGGRTDQAQCR